MDSAQFAEIKSVVANGLSEIASAMKHGQKDHDTLITIKTLVEKAEQGQERQRSDYAAQTALLQKMCDKAHSRIDDVVKAQSDLELKHSATINSEREITNSKMTGLIRMVWATIIIGGLSFIVMCITLIDKKQQHDYSKLDYNFANQAQSKGGTNG